MKYSDTTTKDGIIQDIEHWTGLGDGIISGDTTLLKLFTAKVNHAYDEVLPDLFAADAKWQWDDYNHTKRPIAMTDIVSGQADYSFVTDEDGNSIIAISQAYLKGPDGIFKKLAPVDPQTDVGTDEIFAENSTNTGTPYRYDKNDTSLTLDPVPNYGMTAGLRVVFSRTGSYFVYNDTTKTPGIPVPGQRLLSLIPSRDWLAVNKPDGLVLKQVLQLIADQKAALKAHMSKRDKDARSRIMGARPSAV